MYEKHIVIVGAGIIGLSTAYALLVQGERRVTILEQATVDHPRSSSRGLSRLIRFEYGAQALYSEMAEMSLRRWLSLEQLVQRQLCMRTGVLVLGREDDNETLRSYYTLREQNIDIELLSRDSCGRRFPQFNLHPYNVFTYSKNGSMLFASTILHVLRRMVIDRGGIILESSRVQRIDHDNLARPIGLYLGSGEEYRADQVILAIGPWIHHLLGTLALPVRLTRQYLLYFTGVPKYAFEAPTFPSFMSEDLYGFPVYSHNNGPAWLKAASHAFGSPVKPDETPMIEEDVVERTRRKLCELLPALRSAEMAHTDACIYDVSQDEDFILDWLPDDPRILFATGMSGHAFKFGLLLGEMLGSMARGSTLPVPLDRFRMDRFSLPLSKLGVSAI